MCEPVTIMAVTSAVSTAFAAYQNIQQGRFQRGVSRYNARVSENEAQRTREAGVERENIQRRRTAELISKQRAQLGAAGVDLGSGSALQLQEDAFAQGEADAMRIRSNFEQRATALETDADLTRSKGDFLNAAGQNAAIGTVLGGIGDVVGTGVADKWFKPNSAARQPGITTTTTGAQANTSFGNIA